MWVDFLIFRYVIYIFGGASHVQNKNLHFIVHTFELVLGNLGGVILPVLLTQNTMHSSTTVENTDTIHNILTIHTSKFLMSSTRVGSRALLAVDQTSLGTFGGVAALLLIESAAVISLHPRFFSVALEFDNPCWL